MTACSAMRAAAMSSASLLASGILLLLGAEITGLLVPLAHLALVMVLAGAVVLVVAFLLAIFPGSGQRLSSCRH